MDAARVVAVRRRPPGTLGTLPRGAPAGFRLGRMVGVPSAVPGNTDAFLVGEARVAIIVARPRHLSRLISSARARSAAVSAGTTAASDRVAISSGGAPYRVRSLRRGGGFSPPT